MKLQVHNGELSWIPEMVEYEGRLYKAPLDLFPFLAINTIIDYLKK